MAGDINASIERMNALVGADIRIRCRRHDLVWARYIVMYSLLMEGMSETQVGIAFGVDHSLVHHAKVRVMDMLDLPQNYIEEYDLYKQYTK